MTPLERKAAFKHAVTMKETTLEAASRDVIGVTWMHLSLGIDEENRRGMSDEVKAKFAKYIGKTAEEVFGDSSSTAAGDGVVELVVEQK
jgi:uncharacterized protein involved in copper resistance